MLNDIGSGIFLVLFNVSFVCCLIFWCFVFVVRWIGVYFLLYFFFFFFFFFFCGVPLISLRSRKFARRMNVPTCASCPRPEFPEKRWWRWCWPKHSWKSLAAIRLAKRSVILKDI